MKNIQKKQDNITVSVDYRTELLGIIQIISSYQQQFPHLLEKQSNRQYIESIEKHFQKFKKHETIKLFDYLTTNHNFCYDAPVALFLQLNKNFANSKLPSYPFKERLNSDPKTYEFIETLPDFIKKSQFASFYQKNTSLYQKFIDDIHNIIAENNLIEYMKKYYDMPLEKRFVINLIPFQTHGNYGYHNQRTIFANICCQPGNQKLEHMYQVDEFELLHLLFHEFSHSIINPLTTKYLKNNDPNLFAKIDKKMDEMAYGSNNTIINEHFIRALTIRYHWHRNKNKRECNQLIKQEKNQGFIYIEKVLEQLENYEKNRHIYPNIEDFYPILIANIIDTYNTENKK